MAVNRAERNRAWIVLKQTRRELARVIPRRRGPRLTIGRGSQNTSNRSTEQRVYTGGSITLAIERLMEEGWEASDARETIRSVVLTRFRKYAAQWSRYCNSDGWLRDLLQADEELRQSIVKRYDIAGLVETAQELQAGGQIGLQDLNRLVELGQKQAAMKSAMRKTGDHPSVDLLTEVYGLHPSLARAVALYSETVPWWAYLAINAFIILASWLFWLAIVDPQNAAFNNDSVGGVGWMHYTILPLFALGMLAAEIFLIKDTPRREKAWQEQLVKYRKAAGEG